MIGEPEQAIAYADKAMRLSPHIPGHVGPILYFAKAIGFSILQDNKEALVWIERAEVAAPEVPLMVFFRSVLLAMAGEEYQARAAMQRYLATDNAPCQDHLSMVRSNGSHTAVVLWFSLSFMGEEIQRWS